MQLCSLLSCKNACVHRQKYMQFTGNNSGISGKNTRHAQAKTIANARKNTPTSAGKMPANEPKKNLPLRAICYDTGGKFICKLQVN